MKLKKLLKAIPEVQVKGLKDIEITGLCNHSKMVFPGNLFIVKRGLTYDGSQFIPEALAAGAAAILTDMYDPTMKNVVQLIHPDVNSIEGALAAEYYERPSEELFVCAVTGTNGKTTTTFLIKHLCDSLQMLCGLIGTIECVVGRQRYQSSRTTPDVVSNQKMMREMRHQGCQALSMEVTSHALQQQRVSHISFDAAIFTNLTQDHLDYHKTMEEYFLAKLKLFEMLHDSPKGSHAVAVINLDDPYAERILKRCQTQTITYSCSSPNADLIAKDIRLSPRGASFTIEGFGQKATLKWEMIGQFNVSNALAALAPLLHKGYPLQKLCSLLASFPGVPGRCQKVDNPTGCSILVDYSHTEDALRNVLIALKPIVKGKLIVVFGCGGDRDATKRPKMGRAVEEFADIPIVTSDNPRSENPLEICKQILQGFIKPEAAKVIVDRYQAIKTAIELASQEDMILIAGKGHEAVQVLAQKTIPFDDRLVAEEICRERAQTFQGAH